jgi:hypothetical protein
VFTMTINKNRWIGLGTLGVMTCATLGVTGAKPAEASSEGRKNTALAAAAVGIYGLLKGNDTLAIAGAVGAGVGYHNYKAAKDREEREACYDDQWRRGDRGRYYDYRRNDRGRHHR